MKTGEMIIAVDSREQKPYRFEGSEVKNLLTGDYSIVGFEDRIAIERKTKPDAYASLGRNRARFQRELERLSRLDYAAIVVESSLKDFLQVPLFTKMNPRSAVCTLLAWSVRYRVFVFFASDRRHGRALTRQLLEKYWKYFMETRDDG